MDSVTWLVLLRESVDWERYLRPLIGISSNTGLVGQKEKKKRFNMNEHVIVTHTGNGFNEEKKKSRGFRNISLRTKCFYLGQKKTKNTDAGCSSPSDVAYGETLGEVVAMESHDGGGSPRWREGERGVLFR